MNSRTNRPEYSYRLKTDNPDFCPVVTLSDILSRRTHTHMYIYEFLYIYYGAIDY